MTDAVQRLWMSLADRYRVDREIGHGGMATVYLARDLKHGRAVMMIGEQMRGHPEHPLSTFAQGPGPAPSSIWYFVQGFLNLAVNDHPQALAAFALCEAEPADLFTVFSAFLSAAVRGDQSARAALTPEVEQAGWHDSSYAEFVAEGFALLNDAEQAARWLDRSVDLGFGCYAGLAEHNALWRRWRGHPLLKPVFERLRVQSAYYESLPIAPRLAELLKRGT